MSPPPHILSNVNQWGLWSVLLSLLVLAVFSISSVTATSAAASRAESELSVTTTTSSRTWADSSHPDLMKTTAAAESLASRVGSSLSTTKGAQGAPSLPNNNNNNKYHVSVTGLQLKGWWYQPFFWRYAIPAMIQAQSAPGNVLADAQSLRGIQHTLTVWTDRTHMLDYYLHQGAHLQAMKMSSWLGRYGKVVGYSSDTIPTWEEALQKWEQEGRVVLGTEATRIP